MKILIYGLKESIGGIELVVLNYAKQLIKAKIECVFIINPNHDILKQKIISIGGEYIPCPTRRENLSEYKKCLKGTFKNNSFNAVWCNFSGLTNIDILKLAKKHSIPLRICHSHTSALSHSGIFMKFLVPFLHYKNRLFINKFATHFWACSKKSGEFMFPKKIHKKIQIWHNAIDTDRFHPNIPLGEETRQELGIQNNYVIGHIARICKEKNQEFLLKIFRQVLNRNKTAKLLFIGDGEEIKDLICLSKQLGIYNDILFLGERFNTEKYYNAMDVFCLPSLNEGLGLVLIEAQSCGVPCVVSDFVPKESDITNTTKFLNFQNFDNWCDALLNPPKPQNPKKAVIKNGYDIKNQGEKMADFFRE